MCSLSPLQAGSLQDVPGPEHPGLTPPPSSQWGPQPKTHICLLFGAWWATPLLSTGEDSPPCLTPRGEVSQDPPSIKDTQASGVCTVCAVQTMGRAGRGTQGHVHLPRLCLGKGQGCPGTKIPSTSGASVLTGALPEVRQGQIRSLSSHSSRPLFRPEPLEVTIQEGGPVVSMSYCPTQCVPQVSNVGQGMGSPEITEKVSIAVL